MAAELPPGTPEIDDPLLVADLIKLLSIKGAIGRLPLADIVIPVVNLGDVVQPTVETRVNPWRSSDVFSIGPQIAVAAGTVLADTGALPQGIYDVAVMCQGVDDSAPTTEAINLEHRDAANAANLAVWSHMIFDNTVSMVVFPYYTFSYELGVNERLRAVLTDTLPASRVAGATIFCRIQS